MPSNQKEADVSRPVVLYAESMEVSPNVEAYFETRRLSVIDIEIDIVMAEQIMKKLQERVDGCLGSVRIRFTGRLVHL